MAHDVLQNNQGSMKSDASRMPEHDDELKNHWLLVVFLKLHGRMNICAELIRIAHLHTEFRLLLKSVLLEYLRQHRAAQNFQASFGNLNHLRQPLFNEDEWAILSVAWSSACGTCFNYPLICSFGSDVTSASNVQ